MEGGDSSTGRIHRSHYAEVFDRISMEDQQLIAWLFDEYIRVQSEANRRFKLGMNNLENIIKFINDKLERNMSARHLDVVFYLLRDRVQQEIM